MTTLEQLENEIETLSNISTAAAGIIVKIRSIPGYPNAAEICEFLAKLHGVNSEIWQDKYKEKESLKNAN